MITLVYTIILIFVILVTLYNYALSGIGFIKKWNNPSLPVEKFKTFAIVIPAHNEEGVISHTLHSCFDLDYPSTHYDIFVVADNCTDNTANVADSMGVNCLIRNNSNLQGKGYALSWAFEQILFKPYSAVIVLDADCIIDSHALHRFNDLLSDGYRVLQANYKVSNPDTNSLSYTFAVGNCIENHLFYAPKSRLGLSVFLRGTGMVFERSVLQEFPWQAHSIVEDVEYTITLLRAGIPITYVDDVNVLSDFPVSSHQLKVQRQRWASGNIKLGKTYAIQLIFEGIKTRRFILVDAGWTLLILSRPLQLFVITLLAAIGVIGFYKGLLRPKTLAAVLVTYVLQVFYFMLGVIRLGLNRRRIGLLLKTVGVMLELVRVSILGILGKDNDEWARTPRKI